MRREQTVDLAVIGGGSAGVRCARVAASLGARVTLFEPAALGGTCVNLGCIPKKLLGYGAEVAHQLADARAMGWSVGAATLDWATLLARKDAEITRLNGVYERLLLGAGVQIVRAHASIEGAAGALAVRADGRAFPATRVVIATGGVPKRPPIPGAALADVSDDFFHWPVLPRSVAIVGAGYVAVEIASVLSALGVEVQVLARHGVLSAFDPDVGTALARGLAAHGVRVREGCGDVAAIERTAGGLAVVDGRGERALAERVLLAVGRTPRIDGIGLEALGVATEGGAVVVGARFEASVAGVHAIGDVIARRELTPVALAEGTLLARSLFGGGSGALDYERVPAAVFSMPPVATVGLTEPAARARGEVRVFEAAFRPLKHRLTGADETTMMKIVVDASSDRVLGIHVVGEDAPEIIQGFAVAVAMGATKAQLDATLGVHPTAAEELVTMRTPVR